MQFPVGQRVVVNGYVIPKKPAFKVFNVQNVRTQLTCLCPRSVCEHSRVLGQTSSAHTAPFHPFTHGALRPLTFFLASEKLPFDLLKPSSVVAHVIIVHPTGDIVTDMRPCDRTHVNVARASAK